MPSFARVRLPAALLVASLILAVVVVGCGHGSAGVTISTSTGTGAVNSTSGKAPAGASGDAVLAKAFAEHTSGLEVEGAGTVQRVLSDDVNGERHQRFIVELASGQTILVAHNIDVASRVTGLAAGDPVSFKGQYEWNEQGGTVHWTHRDPSGDHVAGWIEYQGTKYQ